MLKREKRALGDPFGLKNFGVNLTRLFPGGESPSYTGTASRTSSSTSCKASRPWSPMPAKSLCGRACVGDFPRQAWRTSSSTAPLSTSCILKSATALPATRAFYPVDDLQASLDAAGKWVFARKDGTLY